MPMKTQGVIDDMGEWCSYIRFFSESRHTGWAVITRYPLSCFKHVSKDPRDRILG